MLVAAGGAHTVLLWSDGTAAACGRNDDGRCDVPALSGGLTYTQVAAGGAHTVLLRSDGATTACGGNADGQCRVPALGEGLTYIQVAAGGAHTVLLKSDGAVAACGWNSHGQCDVPALSGGLTYTQVAAGGAHTVLVRSDGTVAACGRNDSRWTDWWPWRRARLRYATCALPPSALPVLVLQALFDGASVQFLTLGGEEFDRVPAGPAERLADVRARLRAGRLARLLGSTFSAADAVLPGGELLSRAPPEETCAVAFAHADYGQEE
ncbi:unnamed protein product, partial [Prorocentrum cordatum]